MLTASTDAFLHCVSQMQEEVAYPSTFAFGRMRGIDLGGTDVVRRFAALDIELCWQLHQLKADSYV